MSETKYPSYVLCFFLFVSVSFSLFPSFGLGHESDQSKKETAIGKIDKKRGIKKREAGRRNTAPECLELYPSFADTADP